MTSTSAWVGTAIHKPTRNPFRILRAVWRTLREPSDTKQVTIVEDVFMSSRMLQKYAGWECAAAHLQGLNPHLDFQLLPVIHREEPSEDLARCRPGSLGYIFASHIIRKELNPTIFPEREIHSDADAIRAHLTQTHDIWHVVTGFGNDLSGEFGVVAFSCAQTRAPIGTLLLGIGLLNTALFAHASLGERLEAITLGWRMGCNAKLLFGIDWSDYWEMPLETVREQLNIPPDNSVGEGVIKSAH
jgi:ubiquinone biosynthesis protein Coq4